MIATATFVSATHILTAYHPFYSAGHLSSIRVQLGYLLRTDSEGKTRLDGVLRCFKVLADRIVSSPRGHLDYVLAEVAPIEPLGNAKASAVVPLVPRLLGELAIGRPAFVLGYVKNANFPRGLSLLYGGKFRQSHRYTKDLGTSISLDYDVLAEGGYSGAPVFDEDFRWIAIHQRRLKKALQPDENNTRWHPYIDEYYPRLPSDELPAQGTPLVDIAQDVAQRRGVAWVCATVPALAAILPANDSYSCDEGRRRAASRADISIGSSGAESGAVP